MVPDDFAFSKITIPLSFHYSTSDKLAVAANVEKLIPKLNNVIYVQRIDEPLNHLDIEWDKNAASLIYSQVLNVLRKY